MVPGHTNHPRSLLYPPTTKQPEDRRREAQEMQIRFKATSLPLFFFMLLDLRRQLFRLCLLTQQLYVGVLT